MTVFCFDRQDKTSQLRNHSLASQFLDHDFEPPYDYIKATTFFSFFVVVAITASLHLHIQCGRHS